MTKRTVFIITILIIALVFAWIGFLWKVFSCGFAGSYPCVETYEFKVSESQLLNIISEVKKENPDLIPTNDNVSKHNYWTFVTFYYSDSKEFVNTWTRTSYDSNHVTLAFEGLTPENNIYGQKLINRDFKYFANREQIRKFENNIVERIRQKINARKKSGT